MLIRQTAESCATTLKRRASVDMPIVPSEVKIKHNARINLLVCYRRTWRMSYPDQSSKAFVTGGSGYLGRNLLSALLSQNYLLSALSQNDEEDDAINHVSAANLVAPAIRLVRGDVLATEALLHGMSGCQTVFHLAAKVGMSGSWQPFQTVTVAGTKAVIAAAQQSGVTRLVHVSSDAVLAGNLTVLHNADEATPLRVPTFYAPYTRSKQLAEQLVLSANLLDGSSLSTVVIRPRLVWGKDDSVMLPQVMKVISAGHYGWLTPSYMTSTCHITNCVECLCLAATKGRPGQVYFVTDGKSTSFQHFMTQLLTIHGIKAPVWTLNASIAWQIATILESLPFLQWGKQHDAGLTRQMLSVLGREVTLTDAKARKELGYKGHVSIEQGMEELRQLVQNKSAP